MQHVHAGAIDALVIIAVYVIFKLMLAVYRARADSESPVFQAVNALQL